MLSRYRNMDLGLLILRLGLAYVFIEHSLQKLTAIPMALGFFTKLGLPFPHFTLFLVCGVELLGGILMLLGLFTDIAGLLLAVDMLGVILTVRSGPMAHGWLAGHEFELMLLLMALAVALIGAGRYSLEKQKNKQQFI